MAATAPARVVNYLSIEQIESLLDAGYRYLGAQEQMGSRDRFEYFAKDTQVYQFKNGSIAPVWMCARSVWDSHIHRICSAELAHEISPAEDAL